MLKYSVKELLARLVILLLGLTVAHFGVTLFLLADLGADPFNVLVQGVFHTLQKLTGWAFLTHGRTHVALCLLIIVVLLFVDRSYIMPGTIACMICGGPIIDLFTALLSAPSFLYAAWSLTSIFGHDKPRTMEGKRCARVRRPPKCGESDWLTRVAMTFSSRSLTSLTECG